MKVTEKRKQVFFALFAILIHVSIDKSFKYAVVRAAMNVSPAPQTSTVGEGVVVNINNKIFEDRPIEVQWRIYHSTSTYKIDGSQSNGVYIRKLTKLERAL